MDESKEKQQYLYRNTNQLANLNSMRLSGKLCDVTIKVNDKEFPAHKNILAASLKYFETMFTKSFQESKQHVVTMQDIEDTDLEAFITYAYSGEMLLTDTNALNMFEVANYLGEENIKKACIDFLEKHLIEEEACRAYKLADAIECFLLKKIAIETILLNFENCSETTEYLDLNYKSLSDILSSANIISVYLQQIFFEGIENWIWHDVKNRRVYLYDLLNFIDITQLDADYLLDYFCKRIEDQEHSDIVKDIISIYNIKSKKVHETEDLKQNLIVAGISNMKLHVQIYDFTKKKWYQFRELTDLNAKWVGQVVILNNKFYCTVCETFDVSLDENMKIHLQGFDLATEQDTTLVSDSRLLRSSAITTCSKFLYLCGGSRKDGSVSNQVLRYSSQTGSFAALPPMIERRYGAVTILYQGYLYVLGGRSESTILNSVEKYHPDTREWTASVSMRKKRAEHAVAILDGKLYVCGGVEEKSVEVYDPEKNCWELLASMSKRRNRFIMIAHDRKLLAIGGNADKAIEVYDPNKNQWQIDEEMSSGLDLTYVRGCSIISSSSYISDVNKGSV